MSIASGTATTAEIVTLYNESLKLEVMLRQYAHGAALGGAPSAQKLGRFTAAQIDAQITALTTAITAVNGS